MPRNFMIYGAYGYTGELVTQLAVQQGYTPLLAGRDETKLTALAKAFQLPCEVVDLTDFQAFDALLQKIGLVLNCAGPFLQTAPFLVEACLRNRVHYLDVTGEIEVFEWIAKQDERAKRAGVVLLPGVGFDVVPSDCLAAHLKKRLPDARWLEMAFEAGQKVSRGTATTMVEGIAKGGMIRKLGKLKPVPMASHTRKVSVAEGKEQLVASIPSADVCTAYYSTGIPNITVYMVTTPLMLAGMKAVRYVNWLLRMKVLQNLLKRMVRKRIAGPDSQYRTTQRSQWWGEVRNPQGNTAVSRLETPEPYQLTAIVALLSANKVLAGEILPGFNTPSLAFGPDFVLEVAGVRRTDEPIKATV